MKKILYILNERKLELWKEGYFYEIHEKKGFYPEPVQEEIYFKFADALKNNEEWVDLRRIYIGN